jgi:hypothetical protein
MERFQYPANSRFTAAYAACNTDFYHFFDSCWLLVAGGWASNWMSIP